MWNRLPAAGSAVPEVPLIGRDGRTRIVVGGAPVERNRVARNRVRGGEHERRYGRIRRERAGVRVVVVRPLPVVQEDHRGEGADASGHAPLRVVRPVAVAQRISDRARALPIAVFGLEVRRSQRVVPIAVDVDVRLVDVRFVHVLVRDLEARDVVEVEVEPPPPAGGARDELVVRGADRDQVVGAVRLHVGDEMTDPRPEGVDVPDLTPVGVGLVPQIPHRDRRRAVVPLDDGPGQFQVVQVQRVRRVVHQVVRRDRVLAEDRHEVRVGSGCPVDHPIEEVPEPRRVRFPVVVRHLHLPVVVHDPNSEERHGRIVRVPHRAVVKDVAEVFAPELIRVRDVRNLRAGSVREDVVQAPDRGVGRRRGDDGPGERGRLVDAEQDDRLSVLHQVRPLGVDEPRQSHRLSHVRRDGLRGGVDRSDPRLDRCTVGHRHLREPVLPASVGRRAAHDRAVHEEFDEVPTGSRRVLDGSEGARFVRSRSLGQDCEGERVRANDGSDGRHGRGNEEQSQRNDDDSDGKASGFRIAVGVEDHPVAGVPVALVRIEIGQGRFPVGERSGATVARSQALPSPTSGRPEVEAGYLAAAPRLSRLISVCETAPQV